MPSLNLRNVLRRNPDRPSLRQRAAALKAAAAKVIRRPKPEETASAAPADTWLRLDTALLSKIRELVAIEAEQAAILDAGSYADAYDAPDWVRLESHREAILSRVIATRAHTMGGLKAKARLYSLESVANLQEPHERLALSIVADLNNADLPPEPDLSACSIQQIARLYEALHATYEHLSSLSQLPCFWDSAGYMLRHEYNPAGKIIEREADRLAGLANHCVDEIAQRDASSDNETDEILMTLVTRELSGNGRIHDPALMRDIATAWGA